jgi:hypothetical protein
MSRDPNGPNVSLNISLMPEAADAMERLAAIARTTNVNIVNLALMITEALIDNGTVPVSALADPVSDESEATA